MGFHRWVGWVVVAASLGLWPLGASAFAPEDDEADEAPPSFDLPPVEVVDERPRQDPLPTPAEEPTGFGTTLQRGRLLGERLEVAQLLLHAPGLTVSNRAGGTTLTLRGSSPDQTLIFLDGIRLTSAAGGGLDLRTLSAHLLESVTILRGNEGALYGPGALGGVALLETRSAPGAHLSLMGGSFGTISLSGSLSAGDESLGGTVALSLDRATGDYPATFDPTPSSRAHDTTKERMSNNDEERGAVLLKGGGRVGALLLRGLLQGSLEERGLPGTLYVRDTQRQATQRLLSSLEVAQWEPGALSLGAGISYRRDAFSVWGAETGSVISQPTVAGDDRPWQIEEGIEGQGKGTLDTGLALLHLNGSVGLERLDSPYHGSPERGRLALGLASEIFLGDRLTVAPALRVDRVGDHAGVSPKIGASLRIARFLELRANVGRSFRPPSLGELYMVLGPVQPNPDLEPEQGLTVDGGAILRGDAFFVQLSAFYSRTDDLISYELVSGGRSKPFNFLDAEVVGGEAEGTLHPLSWLALTGGYGFAKTRNLFDDPRFLGNELPYKPAHRLFARIAIRDDEWEGFTEGHHQSEQWVNRSNTATLPSQTWFRLGAGRRLVQAPWEIWLSAQADNVFDAYLVDQLGFPRPGRAFFVTLRASTQGGAKQRKTR